jgi:signal transduction histidine kinase
MPGLAGDHLVLLWLAVGAWIGVAAAYGAVLELPSAPSPERIGTLSLRRARKMMADHPWFARLQILSVLQQSIEMAVPFYAVHAASLHDPTARNLSAFVVAVALGLVLSGPVWGRLIDRRTDLVIVYGALLAAGAGVFVLIMDQIGDPTAPFWHASLFLLLSLARQGVIQARTRRLSIKAPADERPAMVAFNNALIAFAGVIVALILGAAGHLHDIRTPLVMLILGTVAVAFYVPRAFAD